MGTTAPGLLMRRQGSADLSGFVFTVTVADNDLTMSVPFEAASGYSADFGDVIVDWGDGQQTTLLSASNHEITTASRTHASAAAGTYTVTIHCS